MCRRNLRRAAVSEAERLAAEAADQAEPETTEDQGQPRDAQGRFVKGS